MIETIQFRRDTAANWAGVNPVLAQGEAGVETDTRKAKLGDGVTAWASLPYWNPSGGGSGAVSSVFGRTGAVSAQSGDYSAGQVTGAAPLASPALTGAPTAPTATALDNSTKVATTAYADSAVGVEKTRAQAAEALALPTAGGTMTGAVTLAADPASVLQPATKQYADGNVGGIAFPQAPFAAGKHLPLWKQPSKILTEFQSGHGYTNNAGNTFTANDTADFIMGTQAAKIVTGGAGASANVSNLAQTAFDTTNKVIRLVVKCDDITHLNGFNFFLGSSSLANNWKWIVQGGAAGSNFIVSGQWLVVTLNWHDAVVTGSPVRTSVTDVRLQVTDDNTSNTVTVHYQSIELLPDASATFPNGIVSVCFDDSYESMFALAMPKLAQYGYPAEVFTIQSLIGSGGRLTMAQLKSLQDQMGWALGSHAYLDADHSLTLTGMTAAQADLDLRQTKAWGDANGFRAPAGFAYPKGQYGLTTDSTYTTDIVRRYFNYARTTNSKTKETFPPADPFRLRAISDISSFAGGYAPANLTTATTGDLDLCKTNQTWLILTFHNIVASSPAATTDVLQSDFNAIIDAINAKGIPVLPIEDVLRSLDQTYPAASVTLNSSIPNADAAAGSAGSGTVPGAWDHAHPRTMWTAPDHGFLTWADNPLLFSNINTVPTAGTLFLVRVHLPVAATVTNVCLWVSTLGTGLTPGQNFAGLYNSSGTLLSATADQTTPWGTATLKIMALTAAQSCAAGDYYVGFFQTGSANLAFSRAALGQSLVNVNLSSATSRFATGATGNTTSMPSSAGTLTSSATAYWAALS